MTRMPTQTSSAAATIPAAIHLPATEPIDITAYLPDPKDEPTA